MRLYRLLLHLYPASFRSEYAGEMCGVFARRLRDTSAVGLPALWIGVLFEILWNALAVHADAMHYASDLATNIGVVVALVLASYLGWQLADPVIAILVALVMLASALGVGRQSLDQLMDHELPDTDRTRIARIARDHPAVKNVHELKTRAAGLSTFIQIHLEMDAAMRLTEAHAVSDAVEKAIQAAYPGAEIIIHQDPEGFEGGGLEREHNP